VWGELAKTAADCVSCLVGTSWGCGTEQSKRAGEVLGQVKVSLGNSLAQIRCYDRLRGLSITNTHLGGGLLRRGSLPPFNFSQPRFLTTEPPAVG